MAEYLIQGESLTAIADAIREYAPELTQMTPAEMAENIEKVYENGKAEVWDAIQNNGNRAIYEFAFREWNNEYFRPKHKVKPTGASGLDYIFYKSSKLKKIEGEYFNLSSFPASSVTKTGMFVECTALEHFEDIGLQAPAKYDVTFYNNQKLHTIDVLRFSKSTTISSGTFYNCKELVNLTVEGTIDQNGLNLQYSTKLSKASITSVINALSTAQSTEGTTKKSITLSQQAVDSAFSDVREWTSLVGSKISHWTINLV